DTGWKPIADALVGDLVYSCDDTGAASFYPVTKTFRHIADKLVHFKGKSIDALVTPNHRMYVQNKGTGGRSFIEAGDLLIDKATNYDIPLTSTTVGKTPHLIYGIPTSAYLRFLGWFIAEGSRFTSSFAIAQSFRANPEKYQLLEQDISDCGFTYSANDNGFIVHARSMPQELKEELRNQGTCAFKHIPRHVFKLDPSLLIELLDTLILGDGHRTSRGNVAYYTTSPQLADDVQVLAQLVGLRGTISRREACIGGLIKGRRISGALTSYTIQINRKQACQLKKLQRQEVLGPVEVACVEVEPHHTIYVRRNGKAFWCGNSNIKFPLITIAALQYHARAYPALVSGTDLVRCRALGPDPTGDRTKRAERISAHMSYQLLEEDENWEVEHDKTLIVQAISGAFKKTYFCPRQRKNVSCLVLPRDLVVPYYTESLETAARISHVFVMSDNDLYEMTARELFLEGKGDAE
ncbi:MAG: hypothetical protein L0Y56_05380, partial [Nitrospira sp.]|nr:hypothetical protein [Nitrospira sp.]